MKTDAPFWQPEDALNLPLSRCNTRVAPKIKLAASGELLLRGFAFHKAFLGQMSGNCNVRCTMRGPGCSKFSRHLLLRLGYFGTRMIKWKRRKDALSKRLRLLVVRITRPSNPSILWRR